MWRSGFRCRPPTIVLPRLPDRQWSPAVRSGIPESLCFAYAERRGARVFLILFLPPSIVLVAVIASVSGSRRYEKASSRAIMAAELERQSPKHLRQPEGGAGATRARAPGSDVRPGGSYQV